MTEPKPLNFRQRFEAWHLAKFRYCVPPSAGAFSLDCEYSNTTQQLRWEAWQANTEDSYQLGPNAGVAHHKGAVQGAQELKDRQLWIALDSLSAIAKFESFDTPARSAAMALHLIKELT